MHERKQSELKELLLETIEDCVATGIYTNYNVHEVAESCSGPFVVCRQDNDM